MKVLTPDIFIFSALVYWIQITDAKSLKKILSLKASKDGHICFYDEGKHKKILISSKKANKRQYLSKAVQPDNFGQQASQPQATIAQRNGNTGDSSTEFQGAGKYRDAGCFKDTETRAVPLLEGSDPQLSGFYKERQDPIAKCASVARSRGFQLFAVQNGGMCLSGPNAHDTYKIHGLARNCKDGKGGSWASDVYIFNDFPLEIHVFTGTLPKAGTDANVYISLSGSMGSSRRVALQLNSADQNPFEAGQKDVFHVNIIPLGSISGITIGHDNSGQATASWFLEKVVVKDAANNMYKFQVNRWFAKDEDDGQIERELSLPLTIKPGSYKPLGCFKERTDVNKERAVPSLEGRDEVLDGQGVTSYRNREYAVEKCADAARKRGYVMFGIQDGGLCATSKEIQNTFNIYGESDDCRTNGTGSTFSSTVYTFADQEPGFKEAESATEDSTTGTTSILTNQPLPPSDPAMQITQGQLPPPQLSQAKENTTNEGTLNQPEPTKNAPTSGSSNTGSSVSKPEPISQEATQGTSPSKTGSTNTKPESTTSNKVPSSETGASKPDSPEVSTGATDSSIKKPEVSTGTTDSSPKKPELSTGATDSSIKKPEVSTGTTDSSPKKPELSTGVTDSSIKKPELSTGATDSSIKKPEVSTGTTDSSPKKPELSTGATDTSTKKPEVSTGITDLSTKKPEVLSGATDSSTTRPESVARKPEINSKPNEKISEGNTQKVTTSMPEKGKVGNAASETNTEPKKVTSPIIETHPSRENTKIPSTPSDTTSLEGVSSLIETPVSTKIHKIAPESRLPGEFTSPGEISNKIFLKTSKKAMPFNEALLDGHYQDGNHLLFPGVQR